MLPWPDGPRSALGFPRRCAEAVRDRLTPDARVLDLGCAVGRCAFELSAVAAEVTGFDASERFIAAAERIRADGELGYRAVVEGDITTPRVARRPPQARPERVRFEVGDACALPTLPPYDVVVLANLLCRLPDPAACLAQMGRLVVPGGLLFITTPGTWQDIWTPREKWLGGVQGLDESVQTLDGLRRRLSPAFRLDRREDMPFLIREHARKYQWSVAEATWWTRAA